MRALRALPSAAKPSSEGSLCVEPRPAKELPAAVSGSTPDELYALLSDIRGVIFALQGGCAAGARGVYSHCSLCRLIRLEVVVLCLLGYNT